MGLGSIVSGAIGAAGSLLGGSMSAQNQAAIAQQNYEHQKEFAQNGIRWKVADAKAAGIHPLYGLGASTSSYSPVSGYGGDFGVGEAASQFGQGIGRAVEAGMTKEERQRENAKREMNEVFELALRRQELEQGAERIKESKLRNQLMQNEVLLNFANSQSALLRGLNPAMPSKARKPGMDGQGNSPSFDKPIPEYGTLRGPDGRLISLVPGQDYAGLYEDKDFIEWWPFIKSGLADFYAKLPGSSGRVGDMVWNKTKGTYEKYIPPRVSRSGQRSLARSHSVQIHDYMY